MIMPYDSYILIDWINRDYLWENILSSNPNAIQILEENPEKINWKRINYNPNAIELLEKNPEEIDWRI